MTMDPKKVLVTGGARGIGREVALAFCKGGSLVMIADRLEDEGVKAASTFFRTCGKTFGYS